MRRMNAFRKTRGFSLFLIILFFFGCSGGGDEREDSDPLSREEADDQSGEESAFSVVWASPSNGSLGVRSDTPIDITFNNEIDPCTVNENTFMVTVDRTSIQGEICVRENILTFYPLFLLSNSETYTIRILTGVKDLEGNPLALEFTATFTTEDIDRMPL